MATTSLARIPHVFKHPSMCELFSPQFLIHLLRLCYRIFAIDTCVCRHSLDISLTKCHRSMSMARSDRQPLPNAAGTSRIARTANNRLGAVISALYSFWTARQAALSSNAQLGAHRRDAYSIIFFSKKPLTCVENDFTSSPDELLTACLRYMPNENEIYTLAIKRAQAIMNLHWSTERCVDSRTNTNYTRN